VGRRRSNKEGGLAALVLAVVVLGGIGKMVGKKENSERTGRETAASITESLERDDQPGTFVTPKSAAKPAPSLPTSPKRNAADTLRIQRFIPSEVVLTQDTGFPVIHRGKDIGLAPVGRGLRAKVRALEGEKLLLEYDDRRQTVPISSTDFLDRVIAEATK
jgi:hypothetical protein